MTNTKPHISKQNMRSPRAAAIAGILFAILYSTSFILILYSIPVVSLDTGEWLESRGDTVALAVSLLPFAGISFLWFMGVVRDRLRHLEDQFFSTLFFGSGILFLAMVFMTAAMAGGLLSIGALDLDLLIDNGIYTVARAIMYQITTMYAVRMAGMFMIVLGTIWLRTGVMPRWMALLTYLVALVLLISIGFTQWIIMLFPAWVFLISVYILYLNYRYRDEVAENDGLTVADQTKSSQSAGEASNGP